MLTTLENTPERLERMKEIASEMFFLLVYVAVTFPYDDNEVLMDKISEIIAHVDGTED